MANRYNCKPISQSRVLKIGVGTDLCPEVRMSEENMFLGVQRKNTTIKHYNETGFKGLYNYKGVKGTVTALVEILVKFWAEEHPTLIGIIGKDMTLEGDKLGGLIIADGIHPFNGEFQENTVFFGTWDLSRNKPVTTLSKDNETYILDTTV